MYDINPFTKNDNTIKTKQKYFHWLTLLNVGEDGFKQTRPNQPISSLLSSYFTATKLTVIEGSSLDDTLTVICT